MPTPFIQKANVVNAIKNVLEHYPLVDGPIKELLQNSDDAGATKQIFVLDRRNHPIDALVNPGYISYQQSPALIAYNDALFKKQDWESLESLFASNKIDDDTAFGQFGQGFRCVYHLTDCPQIFSGTTLALLNLPDGTNLDTSNPNDAQYTSHIAAFQSLPGVAYPSPQPSHPHINGTLIRLPFRTRASNLSIQCPTPEKMLKLFDEFIQHDLECVLLFLRNVKRIEVYEIAADGAVREICSTSVRDEGMLEGSSGEYTTWRTIVETRVSGSAPPHVGAPVNGRAGVPSTTATGTGPGARSGVTKTITTTWRILNCPFTDAPSIEVLNRIPKEYHPEEEMRRRKLNQRVRVAAPLSSVASSTSTSTNSTNSATSAATANGAVTNYGIGYWRSGRLFNGLPLPRANNKKWPIHVDARFAIPPSRQSVRSALEGGFIGEWNSTLFTAFIPQAWTYLLNVLAREDRVKDIFEYWPPPGGFDDSIAPAAGAATRGGSTFGAGVGISGTSISGRPNGMLQTVFDCVVVAKPAIWPVYVAVTSQLPVSPPRTTATTIIPNSGGVALPPPAQVTVPAVQTQLPPPEFAELGNLKIARDDVHFPDLRNALADCGIRFTKPPIHFRSLIEECKRRKFEFLEAQNVYEELLKNVGRLEEAITTKPKHATSILDFLLKGQDVQFLVGLPLLKNVDGQYITLRRLAPPGSTAAMEQTLHPLLDALSAPLFKAYDSNAIALNELPSQIALVIKTKGPGVLNVVELTGEKVASYLSSDPRWTSPPPPVPLPSSPTLPTRSPTPHECTQFLTKFYSWLATQPFASSFLQIPEIRNLYIVPTHIGLRRVQDPAFETKSVPMPLAKCFRALGVALLDSAASSAASFLVGNGVLRRVEDVKAILDGADLAGIAATSTLPGGQSATAPARSLGLTCLEWRSLIDHVVRHADELSEAERRKLRLLPIYPLLDPSNFDTTLIPRPGPIPENKFVTGVTSVEILPIIDGNVFLDLRGYSVGSHEILSFLDPSSSSNPRPLTSTELLSLGVQNFGSQPPEIRVSIVKYATKHEKSVPREILERLWEKPIVVCRDGVERKPGEVVDPMANGGVGDILATCAGVDGERVFDEYLPRSESDADGEILGSLKKLPVCPLRTWLDQEMLLKVTAWISRNERRAEAGEVSRKLFRLLVNNPAYGEFVKAIPNDDRWIITNAGLKATHECRDRSAQFALCDEVYALVDEDIQMTDVLRGVLGWTQKLSHDVLFDQLDATLRKGGDYSKVRDIVKAIGSDELAEEDLAKMRGMIGKREWVPTKGGGLVRPENAVLEHAVDEAGFMEVSFSKAAYPKVVQFLKRMGVMERPTTDAILVRIKELGPGPLDERQLGGTVKLLELLSADLNNDSKKRVFVPDVNRSMRPISDLHFNDTGAPSSHLPREGIKAISHPSVTEPLARKLGIKPLAKELSKFSGYMGESFVTSIRNVLKDYNETQVLIEMLANAVDAGAKRFVLILDDKPGSSEHLISPNLEMFQQSPALLVYNNAEFKEEDFEGLCNTGEGSKKHKGHTIGQFGRGALTMFHLTEFPMLMSSGRAMFIDPLTKHLKDLPRNANSQRMELQMLQRFYPGHLDFVRNLDGLLGFNGQDITSFSGTIFRLPLREADHIESGDPISDVLWSPRDLQERILNAFRAIARNCFIFTQLESIQAYIRTREGVLEELWSFEAVPGRSETDGDFQRRMVQIAENEERPELWQTVSYLVHQASIPEWASKLISQHNLRRPKVELAAFIRPEDAEYEDYHQKSVLFSTMPLTESVGLPVHCSATFITTSDRRHIRLQLDNDPGDQARYNEWLLEEIVPPVYLYLLELLLTDSGVLNHHFWPINEQTAIDRIIIPALYERHLKRSGRRLFQSAYNSQHHLTPNQVVILPEGSPVETVVDFLAPNDVAKYSEPFLSRVTDDAELPPISPRFLRGEILRDRERLTQAFSPASPDEQPRLSTVDLDNLLMFFLDNDPQQLLGLQLLPLNDNSLATFAGSQSQEPIYYVWKHRQLPHQIFANPRRLVHLDFRGDMLLDKGLNVEELTSASMASLIEEVFPKRPILYLAQEPERQQFVNDFWANFPQLRLEEQDIFEFPLVPTISFDRYISLRACRDGDVPIVPSRVDEIACRCLASIGVPIVRRSSPPCPPPLARILENENTFPDFKMRDILRSLNNIAPQVLDQQFRDLPAGDKQHFSDWIRRQLFLDFPEDLAATARSLPVWDACDSAGRYAFVPAEDLVMLPDGLDEDIVAQYVGHRRIVIIPQNPTRIFRDALKKLNVPTLSYGELLSIIEPNLQDSMPDPHHRQEYRRLVEAILDGAEEIAGLEGLRLPSASTFRLRPVGHFYAREEFFLSAFQGGSDHFVALEFNHLEGRLGHLKRMQNIDMEMFSECVGFIANNSNNDGGAMAFDILNDRLRVIMANLEPNAYRWDMIEDMEFIPRMDGELQRPGDGTVAGLDVSQYVQRAFGDLVAPKDLVREEYVEIAWSQRALPTRALSVDLKRTYPELGRPTVVEVIAHLGVLVTQVARDHPNHPAILADLNATYRYLNDKAEASAAHLADLRDEPLFLNVDNPREAGVVWEWASPATLSFDVWDIGNFKSVRRFLQGYKPLLMAAGAQEVYHPTAQVSSSTTAADLGPLSRIRRKYGEMRRNKKLVDVKFITEDDIPDDPLLGHRSFLAANSDHFQESFCSDFGEGQPASANEPVEVPIREYSRACVSLVLDYIYSGTVPDPTPIPLLLKALELAKYWSIHELVEQIQDRIIRGRLLTPQNLDDIQSAATREDCSRLARYCDEYMEDNREYINRVRSQ